MRLQNVVPPSRFLVILISAAFAWTAAAAAPLRPITVSKEGHYLVTSDGKPFFWTADTAWELFHRASRAEIDLYLRKRASQGFNVIQVVALAELDGVRTPTVDGLRPFVGENPLRPDNRYFRALAEMVDSAARHGIYVALFPTRGDTWVGQNWPMSTCQRPEPIGLRSTSCRDAASASAGLTRERASLPKPVWSGRTRPWP